MPRDPYHYFRVEARELLDQLGKGILELEKGAASPDLVPKLLRLAHTLKGAARVVRLPSISDHAHAIEDLLVPFRESPLALPREYIDGLILQLDGIASCLGSLASPDEPGKPGPAQTPIEEPFRTFRLDVTEMDGLLNGITDTSVQAGSMRRTAQSLEQARHLAELLAEQLDTRRPEDPARSRGSSDAPSRARSFADELRTLLCDLERKVTGHLDQLDRCLGSVRETAERLRLVSVEAIFSPLERVVRDMARTQGTRVAFQTSGGEVRLDAHVLSVMQRAVVQLVRNAVAHGIEPESDRQASGKPPEGRILLRVERCGARVRFSCEDDGRGIDCEAIRRIARQKGILSPEAEGMSTEQILRLLLKGGLSTSAMVSGDAGRGVGLDIVREVAAGLGGEVSVRTEPGKGTTVELLVPVSLSSMEALLVEVSDLAAVLPMDSIRHTLLVNEKDLARTPTGDTLVFEGMAIPFLHLSQLLPANQAASQPSKARIAVILGSGSVTAAVGIDRLLGTCTAVVRPLPALAPASRIVAGVVLNAEGNPQVVLDPGEIIALARHATFRQAPLETKEKRPLLVVDDSLTTRMLEQSILESAGYEVDLATSGEEAIELAREKRYGLFLVDIEMPGMDGFEFVGRICSDPALKDTPFILVSSRSSEEDRRKGLESGASAYIAKGEFDQTAFLDIIRRLAG